MKALIEIVAVADLDDLQKLAAMVKEMAKSRELCSAKNKEQ